MRIAILHNAVSEEAAPDEIDVMAQVDAVSGELKNLGHDILILPCDLNLQNLKNQLLSFFPDAVFNLTESLDGHGRLISIIPSLLTSMGIPYTGSPADGIHFTSNKLLAKEKMTAEGLPTPAWSGSYPDDITSPSDILLLSPEKKTWIVKSVWEHASLGLDDTGMVRNGTKEKLFSRMEERSPLLGKECFVEEYIDGREFNISLIADRNSVKVLPPAEILFDGYDKEKPKIVCYNAKWREDSYEYSHTPRRFDFPESDGPLLEILENLSLRAFHLFRLKGYARVDFRVDENGNPFILEVNANPCLSPDAGFQAALDRAGITFNEAISRIIDGALGKNPSRPVPLSRPHPPPACHFSLREDPAPSDIHAIRELVHKTGFFHDYEVDVAVELVEERLAKGSAASGYSFIFLESEGKMIGYACYGPIPCTKNSYDLYWIAVAPRFQKQGFGKILIDETENRIRTKGGKRIYIDTSDSAKYRTTFSFYQNCGYRLVSLINDFYKEGDGKAVFRKVIPDET